MDFGIPALRQKKQEKYTNKGVITFEPVLKEGGGRKMIFNDYALDLLNVKENNNQISFSFAGDNIYIVNTSGQSVPGLKIGKTTNGFADKKHYNYIKNKIYGLAETDSLELFLLETEQEYNSNKVYKLEIINETEDQFTSPCTNHAVAQDESENWHDADMEVNTRLEAEEADEQGYESAKEIEVNDTRELNA